MIVKNFSCSSPALFAAPMDIVKRSEVGKFVVLPKRWIVERTFA
jgi:hypothetical protein